MAAPTPRIRAVPRAALVQLEEGWTALRASTAASTCKRHPRAPGCGRGRPFQPPASAESVTLRDDLFLGESLPHKPPAVVRAYEACEVDGADQLARERNASRAAREALVIAPLPVVAIIFFGTHFERLPLLRAAYEPYFARLVFMSPKAEIADALKRSEPRLRQQSQPSRSFAHRCSRGIKATYACVAEVAREHVRGALAGVLYLHFDLWVQPWRLQLPLRSVWALPAGRIMLKASGPTRLLPLECFNASQTREYRTLHPAWTWSRDLPPSLAGLRRACATVGSSSAAGSHAFDAFCAPRSERLCIGWSDAYYVPAHAVAPFAALSTAFASAGANAELALPTMLHMLASGGAGTHAHYDRLHRLPCWGFCCSSTPCPELLARYACGHRMTLNDARVTHALEALWAP